MSSLTSKSPEDSSQQLIAELHKRYNAWASAIDDENYSEKKWRLRHAIEDVIEGAVAPAASQELRDVAGRMLPHYCWNKVNDNERVDMRLSKKLVLLLQDTMVRLACLGQVDGDKSVAWVCLQRAVECDISNMRDKGQLVNNILTEWLGRSLPCPEKPTQADVVGTIYGGHYWTANFLDFDWADRKLPNKLWKGNQAILRKHETDSESPEITSLPGNLSL